LTTQSLIAGAIHCGLSVADFAYMTVGMILDVMSEFIPEEDRVYKATQEDIDRML